MTKESCADLSPLFQSKTYQGRNCPQVSDEKLAPEWPGTAPEPLCHSSPARYLFSHLNDFSACQEIGALCGELSQVLQEVGGQGPGLA